jgi:hypothetical protein
MKRIFAVLCISIVTLSARCDVIFFPYQYALVSYSAEFIYSYEVAAKIKSSTVFWGGAGIVGSFIFLDEPCAGLEIAVERRRYFKSDQYRKLFISGYLGMALMTNFQDRYDLGFVPGFKLNYKSQLTEHLILEPYLGISLPITLNLDDSVFYFPLPVATIGIRFGLNTIKHNTYENQKDPVAP